MNEPDTTPMTHPSPFHVTPEDLLYRMRENWIYTVHSGHQVMMSTIIPYLEMEAVSRLSKDSSVFSYDAPKLTDGYDEWLSYWVNEASHNCDSHSPIGNAGQHLTVISQAAVNIIMVASALRDALEQKNAELASVLSITLICEAIQGGYSLEYEATLLTNDALKKAKNSAYKNGFGQEQDDMNKARLACIDGAAKRWNENPLILISAMADELEARLLRNIERLPSLDTVPRANTIKAWLRQAAKDGKLTIPEAAQKRGRPPKSEQ